MRFRLSLTTKLVVLMSMMMLTLSVAIVIVLIEQLSVMLDKQHQQAQVQRYQQLVQTDDALVERLVWWVEGVAGQAPEMSIDALWGELVAGRRLTELNYRMETIWLYTPDNLFSTENASQPQSLSIVENLVVTTQADARPHSIISCDKHCLRYLAVPLFRENEELPIVVIKTQISDLLAMFTRAQGGRVLMLNADQRLPVLTIPTSTGLTVEMQNFWAGILSSLSNDDVSNLWGNSSHLVDIEGATWSLSMLQMPHTWGDPVVMLHAYNITALLEDYRRYEKRVVLGAIAILLVFTTLVYGSTRRYHYKLTGLAKRLPLLAQHRYEEFRLLSSGTDVAAGWLPDEADLLLDETQKLATELEKIDANIVLSNAQLERMAMFDTLTGLPNRNMLSFQLRQKLVDGQRNGMSTALLFIDLDDFKKVNDTCGHDRGDDLIKAAAQRITGALREADIAARFGGDEFVVLLSSIQTSEQVACVAEKLMAAFEKAIYVGQQEFYISISIGIAMAQPGQSNVEEMLRHADIAMYEAKRRAGSSVEIFDAAMTRQVIRRVELETEIRTALREGQFFLALQPQIDMVYRKLVGFEALIRWRHPERGVVSPGDFLPVLEGTQLMTEIDEFVLERAISLMQTLASWGYPDLKMAVNLSTARYTDPNLPFLIEKKLLHYGVTASQLALEVTESVLLADTETAIDIMQQMRRMGCSLVIDDFGTGYASFSYLTRLPLDVVKIDRSFVASIQDRIQDRSIVSATINMARDMSLAIVAEGIETEQQYMHLVKLGCDIGQGYWISRPIPETQLRKQLAESIKEGIWQIKLKAA